jgi:SAM-dependent methyltransferase
MNAWFENEQFWKHLFLFLFPESRFAAAVDEVDKILRLSRPGGNAVLDLACGPGRHSMAFARRGFSVTGVDLSPFLLSKARDRARAQKLKVEWIRKNIRDFVRPDSFDLAVNVFSSFGYFEKESDNLAVLQNVRTSLKTGGVFVLDIQGKETLARKFQPVQFHEFGKDSILVDRPSVSEDWNRIRAEWIVIQGKKADKYSISIRLFSGQELKETLVRAGFRDVSLYGDFDGNPYGADAARLVAVCRK